MYPLFSIPQDKVPLVTIYILFILYDIYHNFGIRHFVDICRNILTFKLTGNFLVFKVNGI